MKSGRRKSPWKRDIKIRETRRNKITGVSRIMKSRCDRKFEALIKHRPLFVDVYPLQKTRYNRILLYRYIYIYRKESNFRFIVESFIQCGYEYLFHLFHSTFILYIYIFFYGKIDIQHVRMAH